MSLLIIIPVQLQVMYKAVYQMLVELQVMYKAVCIKTSIVTRNV